MDSVAVHVPELENGLVNLIRMGKSTQIIILQIVELQDKMRREGKLRTQSDVDKFWEEITQPDVFYAQFKVNRSAGEEEYMSCVARKPLFRIYDQVRHKQDCATIEDAWVLDLGSRGIVLSM